MFEDLSSKLEAALKSIRGQDKITEDNIEPAIKAVKRALLEADTNLTVVNTFIKGVKEEALGIDVVRGITPEQKFIEIVHKKLVDTMGQVNETLLCENEKPGIIMLLGLQGAGKTTSAAKLARYLKDQGKNILIIASDTFRPAAQEQLTALGQQIRIDVFVGQPNQTSLQITLDGIKKANDENYNIAIVDTAGRLYIDDDLMQELAEMKQLIRPHDVLLVVDSMIGQEAADLTKAFNEKVGITGAILTKLDGDSRGGAALSINQVSGKPIKFIGTGEKVEALQPFYPDRIASRILGMGDILTLVDKAQKEVEMADVVRMQKKFQDASFDFSDFLQQMKLLKRMGSIGGLLKLLPGMNRIDEKTLKTGEGQLKKIQSMIDSMSSEERKNPNLLHKSPKRRRRIAAGSGHAEADVDKMINDFERMRGMMQGMVRGDFSKMQENLSTVGYPQTKNLHKHGLNQTEKLEKVKEQKKRKGFFDL
jgi:signal recognition particle subunit SRP54